MRNPDRIDIIIEVLRQGWHKVPDWRLGQVIENLKRYMGKEDLFYVEDDEMLDELKKYFDIDDAAAG